jgi:hypothetical protein
MRSSWLDDVRGTVGDRFYRLFLSLTNSAGVTRKIGAFERAIGCS